MLNSCLQDLNSYDIDDHSSEINLRVSSAHYNQWPVTSFCSISLLIWAIFMTNWLTRRNKTKCTRELLNS